MYFSGVLAETGIGIEIVTGQEEIETDEGVEVKREEGKEGEVGIDQNAELHHQSKDVVDQGREKIAALVEVL